MPWKLRSAVSAGLAIAVSLTFAATAAADGLPVPFDAADNAGVTLPDHPYSYATAGAGGDTAVIQTSRDTGEIKTSTELRGTYGVPLVAYDGTPSGLSGDGETLVLIKPRTRFPRAETSFAVLATERMRVVDEIVLEGDFSFDALSPDGETMYLIRYSDPRDPTQYEVRAYDLERGRLLPEPIVDPNESNEEMAGFPQTRAVGPGGRWAYTLYARAERHHPPFVHALDTERGTAVCIDLDLLEGRNVGRLDLAPSADGSELTLLDGETAVASIDLKTFEVADPQALARSDASGDTDEADALPWLALGGGVGLTVLAVLALGRRQREPAT